MWGAMEDELLVSLSRALPVLSFGDHDPEVL
jgi:hypothetical protein